MLSLHSHPHCPSFQQWGIPPSSVTEGLASYHRHLERQFAAQMWKEWRWNDGSRDERTQMKTQDQWWTEETFPPFSKISNSYVLKQQLQWRKQNMSASKLGLYSLWSFNALLFRLLFFPPLFGRGEMSAAVIFHIHSQPSWGHKGLNWSYRQLWDTNVAGCWTKRSQVNSQIFQT